MPDPQIKKVDSEDVLSQRLINCAFDIIREESVDALTARKLAQTASCSLGAIYTRFDDMNHVILHICDEVLHDLGTKLESIADEQISLEDRLSKMVKCYIDLSQKEPNIWNAAFNFYMPTDYNFPDWYKEKAQWILSSVVDLVLQLNPAESKESAIFKVRTLFAAVHGVLLVTSRPGFSVFSELEREAGALLIARAILKVDVPAEV